MLWFNLLGALVVYALQRLQVFLPLNPQEMAAVSPDSAFNTAMSFATNTNWQGYGGESTMSYLTQMLGLGVQNFVSAAVGHGRTRGADPRFRSQAGRRDRQFLVRSRALDGLHPAAAFARASAGAGGPGRRANFRQVRDRHVGPAGHLRRAEERAGRSAAQGRQGQRGHREDDGHRADDSARSRPLRRSRSSSSAPTAAASSTSTRRIRSRIRIR